MNQETPEKSEAVFDEEIKRLSAANEIVCLQKDGEKFYFDSQKLNANQENYKQMRQEGWQIRERIYAPPYLPLRRTTIAKITEQRGLEPWDWGYREKSKDTE